jgi:ribonuclease HI
MAFTDGAAKGNPGPGGWGVVILTPDGRVTELGAAVPHATNNQMELTGAIRALRHLDAVPGAVEIYTDSTYVIKGITEWIFAWRRRDWKTMEGTDVSNRELWQQLSDLVTARGSRNLKWHYVRGHSGIPGNERVDEIADSLAQGLPVELYDGPLSGYSLSLLDIPDNLDVPKRTSGAGARSKSAKAFSYLSVVDGIPKRHATWAECEQRTKGRSGARFKKATSSADEAVVLKQWGFAPEDV